MKTLLERELDEIFLIEGEWDGRLGKPAVFNPMPKYSAHEKEVRYKLDQQRRRNEAKIVCLTGGTDRKTGQKTGRPKRKYSEADAKALEIETNSLLEPYKCLYCGSWHMTHLGTARNVSRY